jgi:hypothetical protein
MEYLKGSFVKFNEDKLEGFLVKFTDENNKDLDGDYFSSETNFGFESKATVPVFFHHGNDPYVKKTQIGTATLVKMDEGLHIQYIIDQRNKYKNFLQSLKKSLDKDGEPVLGWSSGAVPHLLEKEKSGHIKQWILAEASLTYTPAEPTNIVKSLNADKVQKAIDYILRHDLTDVQKEQIKSIFKEEVNKDDVIINELLTTIQEFKWT